MNKDAKKQTSEESKFGSDAVPDDPNKLPDLKRGPLSVLWSEVYRAAIQGAAIVNDTPPKLLSHRAALLADDFLRQLKVRMPQ